MRKSDAKDLLCPRCNQPTLIKSGFTQSKYGRWQRFACMNPDCDLKATTRPVLAQVIRDVPIKPNEQIIIVKRDSKGRFIKK